MYISTSNVLTTSNVSIVSDASSTPISYMINKDFSEICRSGTVSTNYRIKLDVSGLRYIAIAGLDVYGICSSIDFEYWNGSTYVVAKTQNVTSNATLMYINELHQSAASFRITFKKIFSNLRVGVAHIAAGAAWEVPYGGEEGGFARPWTTPQYAQRTQTDQGMPTASVIESVGVSGSVSFSNIPTQTVIDTWAPLQGFAVQNGVFITENRAVLDQSYYCYNCVPSAVKAHSSTRLLQNVSMKFDAWTGRTI